MFRPPVSFRAMFFSTLVVLFFGPSTQAAPQQGETASPETPAARVQGKDTMADRAVPRLVK
ncbi:MAG: hypothetical protein HY046_12115, partial [Acidobacteria bacterium]|nr:hypothetical protein [Acidobacteriota bacterium]